MTRDERRLVKAVHETAGTLLAAANYAEQYMARIAFVSALNDLNDWIEHYKARMRNKA